MHSTSSLSLPSFSLWSLPLSLLVLLCESVIELEAEVPDAPDDPRLRRVEGLCCTRSLRCCSVLFRERGEFRLSRRSFP